jgi:hypothetical protein
MTETLAQTIPLGIATTPRDAAMNLLNFGRELRNSDSRSALFRILIGRQLLEIQQDKLWAKIERRDYSDTNIPEGIPVWEQCELPQHFLSFDDFMHGGGFEMYSGYEWRTGYRFMRYAKDSEEIPDNDLRHVKSMENVISLSKIKEGGSEITPTMIDHAKTMTNREFNTMYDVPQRVTASSVPAAGDKRFIIDHLLGPLQEPELHQLRELVEEGLMRCQDVAAELIRSMDAALRSEWIGQDEAQTDSYQYVNGSTPDNLSETGGW